MPPRPARARRARRSAGLVAVAATLVAAGCGPSGAPDRAEPTRAPSSAAATPTPTTSAAPVPERPVVRAGTVAEGAPATASGEGPARVTVVRDGDFGVVAHLDCAACTGEVVLTSDGRMSPWGAGPAPMTGSYLVDLLTDTEAKQGFLLDASGPWTLTFESWNDLPATTGPQQGSGSTVLVLGDTAAAVRLDYTPAGPGDSMLARVVSAVDVDPATGPASLAFGDEVAFSETADVAMPGVVALSTNGSWTLTPLP